MPAKNDPLKLLKAEAKQLEPIDQVSYWAKVAVAVKEQVEAAVASARDAGEPWKAIADAGSFGTRQATQNRFDTTAKDRNRAGALKHYDEMRREAGLPPRKPRSK